MKKRFLKTLLLGALVVTSTSMVTSCKDYDDDIQANTAQITALQSEVSSLQSALSSCQSSCESKISEVTTSLNTQIAAVEAELSSAKSELQTAINNKADASTVSALQSTVSSLESEVSSLKSSLASQVAALQAQLDAIKTDISNLDAAYKLADQEILSNISSLKSELATLAADNEAAHATLANSIQAVADDLSATTSKAEATEAALAVLQETYDKAVADYALWQESVNNSIATINGQITTLDGELVSVKDLIKTQVDSLGTVLISQDGKIVALGDSIDGINGKIGTINDAIEALETADQQILVQVGTNSELITANQLAIADLETQFATLAGSDNSDRIDSLSEVTINLAQQIANQEVAYKQAIADAVAELTQDIKDVQTLLETNFQSALDAAKAEAEAKYAELQANIDANTTAIQTNSGKIETLETSISDLRDYVNNTFVTIAQYDEDMATLKVLIERQLTSLVLKPAYYFGGIEGIEVPSLKDYTTYTVIEELTADEEFTADGAVINLSDGGVATYHVNPAVADLSGYSLDFYGNDPITRSGIQFVDAKYSTYEELIAADSSYRHDGLLEVPFTVNYDVFNATVDEGKTPMIAFQMSKDERTVTSDYALINLTYYKDFVLADNFGTTANHEQATASTSDGLKNASHLYGQSTTETQHVKAITSKDINASHEIEYNQSLDLNALIETHYSYDGNAGTLSDEVMPTSILKALGLSYKFDLVKYTIDGNLHSEDSYVEILDGVLTPYNESAKGHAPIVRVELVDASGNVLKYGYVKIQIAGNAAPTAAVTFGNEDLTCTGVVFDVPDKTVEAVAQELANQYEYTYTQFNSTLYLETSGSSLVQYAYANNAYTENNTAIGVITTVAESTDVTKFNWTLTYDEASNDDTWAFDENGVSTKSLTTYVKYTNGGNLAAYVSLTIPAGAITRPVLSLSSDNKIAARWYNRNDTTQTGELEDLNEIHINPEVVGQTDADDEIYYDMLNGFLDKEVLFENPDGVVYTSSVVSDFAFRFITKPGVDTWTVTGNTGNTYTITVSDDGLKLYATTTKTTDQGTAYAGIVNEEIATLSGTNNAIVTYNTKNQDEYLVAYDILNKSGHKEMAADETFQAFIGVYALVCEYEYVDYFTARFLRPLDLATTSTHPATDAVDGGYYVNIVDLIDEDPKDWREAWEDSYWTYYGVDSIQVDLDNAFTDAALTADKRVAIEVPASTAGEEQIEGLAKITTANIQLTYVSPDNTFKYGRLLYTNNNATIGDFHIYVPITMTYDWGYKMSMGYARIDVSSTVENAK